jgi:hypothetical protein
MEFVDTVARAADRPAASVADDTTRAFFGIDEPQATQ